jgi:chromosome segregation ATPase
LQPSLTMVDSRKGEQMANGIDDLTVRMQVVEEKVDHVSTALEQVVASVGERFNSVDAAIREQREYTEFAFSRLEAKIGVQMEAGFGRLEAKSDRLEMKTDRLDAKTDRLETRMDRLDAKTDRLETRMDRLETKTDHLDTKTDRLETKTDRIEGKIDVGLGRLERRLDHIVEALLPRRTPKKRS